MAWSSSRRRDRFNPGWPRVRAMILERDHHQCQRWVTDWRNGLRRRCLLPADEVDHIRRAGPGERDDDSPSNLEALCSYHHMLKTAGESGASRVERRRRREVDAWYRHPAYG